MRDTLVAIEGRLARPSGTISVEAAARLLGTAPATLQLWQERFGYPEPAGEGEGGTRYSYAAVIALREALDRELSVAAAVAAASPRHVAE
jgi:hypothetical protein